jgi:hypothetical protein
LSDPKDPEGTREREEFEWLQYEGQKGAKLSDLDIDEDKE